jgi:hypothetical protein
VPEHYKAEEDLASAEMKKAKAFMKRQKTTADAEANAVHEEIENDFDINI